MSRITGWGLLLALTVVALSTPAVAQYGYGYGGQAYPDDASRTTYTPGDGADWTDPDPTLVQTALDGLAAIVAGVSAGLDATGEAAGNLLTADGANGYGWVNPGGTAVGDLVELEDVGGGTAGLPAVDGSQLTGVVAGASNDSLRTRSTGLWKGGLVTINGGDNTAFDISAGGASFADAFTDPDNPVSQSIEWAALTAISATEIGSNPRVYVGLRLDNVAPASGSITPVTVTIDGVPGQTAYVVQSHDLFSPADARDIVQLAVVVHPGASILLVENLPTINVHPPLLAYDLAFTLQPINRTGNVYSANGANLSIDKSAGETFRVGAAYDGTSAGLKSPNITSDAAGTALTFRYRYRDGVGGFTEAADDTTINPSLYDDGSGTLADPGANKWTVPRIFFLTSGDTRIQYGQEIFNSKAEALSVALTSDFETQPNLLTNATWRGALVVRRGATNLSDPNDAAFVTVGTFGVSGGGGEVNTASTEAAATGQPVYSSKSGVDLRFHGISGSEGVTTSLISEDVDVQLDVNGLAADATPNGAADYVVTYDADAAAHKKVLLDNLPGAGGLSNVVEDATPQLGGDLDVAGQSIVSVANGDVTIAPDGTGVVDVTKTTTIPEFSFTRDDPVPVNGAILGRTSWFGDNDVGTAVRFARVAGVSSSVANGAESGAVTLEIVDAGTLQPAMTYRRGSTSVHHTTGTPVVQMVKDDPTPIVDDVLGSLQMVGDNDIGTATTFARVEGRVRNLTNGGEFGAVCLDVVNNGVIETVMEARGFGIYMPEDKAILFEGGTANDFETTLSAFGPTADRGISLPDASGTLITTGNADAGAITTNPADADHVLINDGGVLKRITPANLPSPPTLQVSAYYAGAGDATDTQCAGSTTTALLYDTEDHDAGGDYDNTTGVITIPRDGYYCLRASLGHSGNTTLFAVVQVNTGGGYTTVRGGNQATIYEISQVTHCMDLTSGDLVRIACYNNSATAGRLRGTGYSGSRAEYGQNLMSLSAWEVN